MPEDQAGLNASSMHDHEGTLPEPDEDPGREHAFHDAQDLPERARQREAGHDQPALIDAEPEDERGDLGEHEGGDRLSLAEEIVVELAVTQEAHEQAHHPRRQRPPRLAIAGLLGRQVQPIGERGRDRVPEDDHEGHRCRRQQRRSPTPARSSRRKYALVIRQVVVLDPALVRADQRRAERQHGRAKRGGLTPGCAAPCHAGPPRSTSLTSLWLSPESSNLAVRKACSRRPSCRRARRWRRASCRTRSGRAPGRAGAGARRRSPGAGRARRRSVRRHALDRAGRRRPGPRAGWRARTARSRRRAGQLDQPVEEQVALHGRERVDHQLVHVRGIGAQGAPRGDVERDRAPAQQPAAGRANLEDDRPEDQQPPRVLGEQRRELVANHAGAQRRGGQGAQLRREAVLGGRHRRRCGCTAAARGDPRADIRAWPRRGPCARRVRPRARAPPIVSPGTRPRNGDTENSPRSTRRTPRSARRARTAIAARSATRTRFPPARGDRWPCASELRRRRCRPGRGAGAGRRRAQSTSSGAAVGAFGSPASMSVELVIKW